MAKKSGGEPAPSAARPHDVAARSLACCVAARLPALLWGDPGIGKTAIVRAIAERHGLPLETVILSLREPADLAGLPVVHNGAVSLAPPSWAKRLADAGKGILFLDELSTAAPAVQAAALRVVDERTVCDLTLPADVAIVAAANPTGTSACGWDLAPALANRWVHLSWLPPPAEALSDAIMTGAWPTPHIPELEPGWRDSPAAVRARGVFAAYLKTRHPPVCQIPPNPADAGRAWPSPRTWERRALPALQAAVCAGESLHGEVALTLMAGCVGEGLAADWGSWIQQQDLPDPEALLQDPSSYRHPGRGDRVWVAMTSVVAAVLANNTAPRWEAAWEVFARAAKEGAADVAAAAARPLASNRPDRAKVPKAAVELLPVLKAAGLAHAA